MHEERFVVEVSEPVPATEVGGVAGRIALHLHMDAARVLKLLDGRTGPVTKPVLREKADVIAGAFDEAGVSVVVRPADPPAPATPPVGKGETLPPGASNVTPATSTDAASMAHSITTAPNSRARDQARDQAGNEDRDHDAARDESRAESRDPPGDPTGPGGRIGTVTSAASAGKHAYSTTESTPSAAFLSSTRWVPSPHEDLGYSPDDLDGDVDEFPDEPSAMPRSSYSADASWAAKRSRQRDDGPGLRSFLLVGLVVSLVLLLVLQAVNRNRGSQVPDGATVAMGLDAYRSGDFVGAGRIWRPLAEAGDPTAQYMLGYMAQHGQGQPWSNHEAATWYQRAADLGYAQAQLDLGLLYLRGMGVDRDASKAAALLRSAAESGYGAAQYQYALRLFQGEGVARDFAAAQRWFRAAADHGVTEAGAYVEFLRPAERLDAEAEPAGTLNAGTEP